MIVTNVGEKKWDAMKIMIILDYTEVWYLIIVSYLSIQKWQMGDNIYLATLIEEINNVTGVLNVTDIKVYNKVGGTYSANAISQAYVDDTTRQINLTADYALFGEFDTMFEVKFPDTDIRVRTKS